MEVHEWSNIDILEMFSAILNLQQSPEPEVDCSRDRDVELEPSWDSGLPVALRTASRIFYLRTTQNWPMSSICLKFRIDKQQIVKNSKLFSSQVKQTQREDHQRAHSNGENSATNISTGFKLHEELFASTCGKAKTENGFRASFWRSLRSHFQK